MMKPVTIIFVLILVLLQYRLWVGNGSITEVNELKDQIARIEAENKLLRERNQSLAAEVLDLKQGHEAIEERARSEMGMVKYDETFYQIIDYSAAQTN